MSKEKKDASRMEQKRKSNKDTDLAESSLSPREMEEIVALADQARTEEEDAPTKIHKLKKKINESLADDSHEAEKDEDLEDSLEGGVEKTTEEETESLLGVEYRGKKTRAQIKALKGLTTPLWSGTKVTARIGGGITWMAGWGLTKNLWKEAKLISKILWGTVKGAVTGGNVKQPTWREMWKEFSEEEKEQKQQ